MGTWGGQPVATFVDWRFGTGFDLNSFDADPQFTDAAHGNYRLLPGSPAIDRGDPTTSYFGEPVGSTFGDGSRVDIGAGGNSANAAQSPAQMVQLFGQPTYPRYQVGQPPPFRSAPTGSWPRIRCSFLTWAAASSRDRSPGTYSRRINSAHPAIFT
jgi:hypothetical protein